MNVASDLHFLVSRKIKEEFENGRDSYELHGMEMRLPIKRPTILKRRRCGGTMRIGFWGEASRPIRKTEPWLSARMPEFENLHDFLFVGNGVVQMELDCGQ
ncbi:MAG TPA: hypothetical protein VHL58_07140 [Thermoanaerobaculia bacterium]|nr:hypothetical protein [Thermoanaerobaculia bacterium]